MGNKLFGTDGVRGVANEFPMTAEFAFKLAQVLSFQVCTDRRRVAVAKDTRVSSDMLEAALIAGFTSTGVDVVKCGVVPTPLLTAQVENLNVDMALMITASHNPYFDNGIKLIDRTGHKFADDRTLKIEMAMASDVKVVYSKDAIGRVFEDDRSITAYMENARRLAPNFNALKGLRVVLDCANGAFSKIMPQIFKDLGAGVLMLADHPDGYNINRDCGSQHTELMQKTVVESHAHLGIAVDGDGDRIIICDEKGVRIDGDQIIAFLATYYKNNGLLKANAVVATIWSNLGLEKYLASLGIAFYRTAVGERYVIDKMIETGANVGGEESGHMVLSDYAKTGDALLTGLVICLGLQQSGKKMSEIFPMFEKCPCLLNNIRFANAAQAAAAFESAAVKEAVMEAKNAIAGKGSVIVRKSGTEPTLKIRVEGEDESLVSELSAKLVEVIDKCR